MNPRLCAQKASSAHHVKHQQLDISREWMKGKDPNMDQIFCLLLGSPRFLDPYSTFCCKVSIHKQLFEALIVTLLQNGSDLEFFPHSVREPKPLYYVLQNTYYHGPFQNRFLTSNLIWYLWHFCDIRWVLFSSFSHVKKSEPGELILNNPLP